MARRKRTETEATIVEQAENGAVLEDEVVETAEQVEDQAPEAEAEVEESGDRCALCNRPLRAEQSVTRGLGPVCAGHVARLAKAQGLVLTAKEGEEGYIAPDALEVLINEAKTPNAQVAVDDFNPDENVHPAFPDDGPIKFVKVAEVHKAVVAAGRSLTSFVKAFGGDRAQLEPLSKDWTPVYVGRVRYLPATALDRIEIDLPLVRERKAKEATPEVAPDADQAEAPAEAEETGGIEDEEVTES